MSEYKGFHPWCGAEYVLGFEDGRAGRPRRWDDWTERGVWPERMREAYALGHAAGVAREHPLSLGAGWRWLEDPARRTMVLLHEGGLWAEVDADSFEYPGDVGGWRAVAEALGSGVEAGLVGRWVVVVEVSDGVARAWLELHGRTDFSRVGGEAPTMPVAREPLPDRG